LGRGGRDFRRKEREQSSILKSKEFLSGRCGVFQGKGKRSRKNSSGEKESSITNMVYARKVEEESRFLLLTFWTKGFLYLFKREDSAIRGLQGGRTTLFTKNILI